jgi:arsenite-transporting ATPase
MTVVSDAHDRLVSTSMADFSAAHPDLRYLFFGGKGGVGKTVMAGVTALHLASTGKRVLLASTNPVHSLSGLLDQDVFGRHTPVTGTDNLWALEIDTRDSIERAKRDIKEKIEWFLKFAEIKTKADEFVGAATTNPAFEESAMFENMTDLMFADEYDVYVFDTAPTANARRLRGMSKVYGLWVNKMVKSREEAPIAVIRRFITWFTDFGIPVGGVVVNQVIEPGSQEDMPEFVRNRVAMQADHLRAIGEEFPGMVRGVLPLHDDEIRGVGELRTTAAELFGQPVSP